MNHDIVFLSFNVFKTDFSGQKRKRDWIQNSLCVFPMWKSEAKTNDGPASCVSSNHECGEGSCRCQSCVVRLTHDDLRAQTEKQTNQMCERRAPCRTKYHRFKQEFCNNKMILSSVSESVFHSLLWTCERELRSDQTFLFRLFDVWWCSSTAAMFPSWPIFSSSSSFSFSLYRPLGDVACNLSSSWTVSPELKVQMETRIRPKHSTWFFFSLIHERFRAQSKNTHTHTSIFSSKSTHSVVKCSFAQRGIIIGRYFLRSCSGHYLPSDYFLSLLAVLVQTLHQCSDLL